MDTADESAEDEVNVFVVEKEDDDGDAQDEIPRITFRGAEGEEPLVPATDGGPTLLVVQDTQTKVEVYDEEQELELQWSNELLVSPLPREAGRRQQGLTSEEAAR